MDPRIIGLVAVVAWLTICYIGIVIWDRAHRRATRKTTEQKRLEYLAALDQIDRKRGTR